MAPPKTKEDRIARAAKILADDRVPVAARIAWLKEKGVSDIEITEAMNIAGNGELLKTALAWPEGP